MRWMTWQAMSARSYFLNALDDVPGNICQVLIPNALDDVAGDTCLALVHG